MTEVGFQRINTYADFQETYKADDPDFFIHIAEKEYMKPEQNTTYTEEYSGAVDVTRDYYNNSAADRVYATIWGARIFTSECIIAKKSLYSMQAAELSNAWQRRYPIWMPIHASSISEQATAVRHGILLKNTDAM